MKGVTPHWLRRLATLCNERAAEYRQPYIDNDEDLSFPMSGSYQIYSVLLEMHMLLNKLADEMDEAEKDS